MAQRRQGSETGDWAGEGEGTREQGKEGTRGGERDGGREEGRERREERGATYKHGVGKEQERMCYEEVSREEGEPEKEGWSGAQRAASASNTKLAPCVPACIHTHTHDHTRTHRNIHTHKHTVQIAFRLVFLRGCVSILYT